MLEKVACVIATLVIPFFLYLCISFGIVSGIVWMVCWCFGLIFSWKVAFGSYIVILVVWWFIRLVINACKKK